MALLGRRGVVNNALVAMGLADRPLALINTRFAVYLAMVHVLLPFMVLPLYATLRGLDWVLVRAAEGLGARPPDELIELDERYPGVSTPVDRLMRHLKTGKLAERLNWSVTDDPALFQVEGKHRTDHDPSITAGNAAERLFLRVERQTLSRLPASGYVLFTIRVHSYPLPLVVAQPGAADRLAAAVRALPTEVAIYKSLPSFRLALLDHLVGMAGADRQSLA